MATSILAIYSVKGLSSNQFIIQAVVKIFTEYYSTGRCLLIAISNDLQQ